MVGPPGAKPPSKFYDNLYEDTTRLFRCSAYGLCVFLQPLIHYNNETDENSIKSWT